MLIKVRLASALIFVSYVVVVSGIELLDELVVVTSGIELLEELVVVVVVLQVSASTQKRIIKDWDDLRNSGLELGAARG